MKAWPRSKRFIPVLLLGIPCFFASLVQGSEGLLASSRILSQARNLRFALHMDAGTPLLLVRCGEMRRDRARWGMFKVALLPRISMRNLELQVLDSRDSGDWARLFSSFLADEPPAASFGVDGFSLKDPTGAARVAARRAEIAEKGRVILLKSVTILEGPQAGTFGQAKLLLTGQEAGLIEVSGSIDRFNPVCNQ